MNFFLKPIFIILIDYFLEVKRNYLIVGGSSMKDFGYVKKRINELIKPILETWSKKKLSDDVTIFGIRRYLRGARMRLHVDKKRTHVISAILQVWIASWVN